MRRLVFFIFALFACLLSACNGGNGVAKIKVEFSGMKQKMFVVEEIVPGRILFLDSIKTNNSGKFTFKYKFKDNNPAFIRIRLDQDYLLLLASPGENIEVNTIINLARNYSVKGSAGSELVRQVNVDALNTQNEMEKESLAYGRATIQDEKIKAEIRLAELYRAQKRKSAEFVARNSKSMASIVALYQVFPNGIEVFGDKNDHLFFSMVADSLSSVYPTSPHVKLLVKNVENKTMAIDKTNSIVFNRTVPDIDLPDIYGVNQKLSSLIKSKVVLLTFWSATHPGSGMLNQELKELYKRMKGRDFEIYQVSLDTDKTAWVSSVVEQNLPWVSVRDEAGGTRSVPARVYQVKSLPYHFIISGEGEDIAQNIWGADLVNKIEELTKQ